MAEEGACLDPPAGFLFQRLGRSRGHSSRCGQCLGSAIDEREHVPRVPCLHVTVAAGGNNLPARPRISAGKRRTSKGSCTSAAIAASAHACSGSLSAIATVVVV